MRQGIRAYDAEKYKEALSHFEAAEVEAPEDPKVRYNAAVARYRTGDFESAAKEFGQVLSKTKDPKLKAKTYYNLGNTAFRKKDLKAAAGFYRKALSITPQDREAKENLAFVLKKMKERKEEEQKGKSGTKEKPGTQKKEKNGSSSDRGKNGQAKKESSGDHPASRPEDRPGKQAQQPGGKGQEEKNPQQAGMRKDQEKPPQGKIREAGSGGKEKTQKDHAPSGRAVAGRALSPDEVKRLLNSLSDDQRAYFREQAARKAPGKQDIEEDW